MLNFFKVTQAQFYREMEGKQVALLDAGTTTRATFSSLLESVEPTKAAINSGKFVKRSSDFYRLLADGRKSYGHTKGSTVFKACTDEGKAVFVIHEARQGFAYDWFLVYRVEEGRQA